MVTTIGKRISSILISVANSFFKSILCIPTGTCRFTPSCSDYAQQAIKQLPLLKAIFKISWRILRCNPFCRGGFDPVVSSTRKV